MDSWLWAELLPGIPEDIVLEEIAVNLPSRDVATLSVLSHRWHQAVQDREVYDARVRHHSTEPYLVLHVWDTQFTGPVLYCLRDHTLHHLPPIPPSMSWLECTFVALDGKLYILGYNQQVYVLDLGGQRDWRPCANMLEPRQSFGCGVLDGKIYAFGGSSLDGDHTPVCGSEMYDAQLNSWFPIKPMISGGNVGRVILTSVGMELFVQQRFEHSWQVYHPQKDAWRVVEGLRMGHQRAFTVQGQLYSMSSEGIHVFDAEKASWTHQHTISCDELGPKEYVSICPYFILPMNNELLAIVLWDRTDFETEGWCLLQSKGFNGSFSSKNQQIVWSKVPSSLESVDLGGGICLIQL
ncbi:unnamed protein product [Calypogeia fissa]